MFSRQKNIFPQNNPPIFEGIRMFSDRLVRVVFANDFFFIASDSNSNGVVFCNIYFIFDLNGNLFVLNFNFSDELPWKFVDVCVYVDGGMLFFWSFVFLMRNGSTNKYSIWRMQQFGWWAQLVFIPVENPTHDANAFEFYPATNCNQLFRKCFG